MRRWFGLLPLVVLAVTWWGLSPAAARSGGRDTCLTKELDSSSVNARIRFDQHGKDYVKVSSYMTIIVPISDWELARKLTADKESKDYRTAMRCLLRGQDNSQRKDEWLYHEPFVTADATTVKVQYDCFGWIKSHAPILLGPWTIDNDHGQTWMASLHPSALQNIAWYRVEADLGGLGFIDHSGQAISSDGKTLVWRYERPEKISIEGDLPWKRSWVLAYDDSRWSSVGVATWWVCASVVIALAARHQRSAVPGAQDGGAVTADGGRADNPARALLQWALLSGAVAVILVLVLSQPHVSSRWRTLGCLVTGWTLVLVARPWSPGPTAPDGPKAQASRRRQARTVIGVATVTAALGMLVVLAPELFDLPPDLSPETTMPTALGRIGYGLMGLTTLWLWLAAMAAWAWRFASEGRLLPKAWVKTWNRAPVRCVAVVSIPLWIIAGCLHACLWWVNEHQWQRVAWLTDQRGTRSHGHYVNDYLANFSFSYLMWIFSYSWALTGVALFALLHHRFKSQRHHAGQKGEHTGLGPDQADFLLIAAVFALTVGLRGARISGTTAQWSLWLVLNIGSLFLVLAAGRRWSVLSRLGDHFYPNRLSTGKRRGELLEKAREYRGVNHQQRLLDQGRGGAVTGAELEGKLRGLRQWLVDGCEGKKPPEHLSVLGVALAWGPQAHWWSNAMRAARLAFWFGLPASAALLYLNTAGAWAATTLTYEPTAIPNVVANFVAYQVAWVGAGFVLGALWRLLPGGGSPLRAWSLTFAYAVPACLTALLIQFTDTDFVPLLLYSVLMLTVLTLTSISMDLATFRKEQQYWPSRFALLQSIYQLRGLSGQVAWLFAQMAVIVTIVTTLAKARH
ncbi:DUF6185 family protein [Streptomyces sp. NPDC005921]|uniref:DUF6185 family protein n=1 Tax=Streptomyces sp. NPDC005827 TaxID=3157070 RepID=UPI0033E2B3C1